MKKKKFVLIDLNWNVDQESFPFPRDRQFAGTGYKLSEGPQALFSVWVELTDWTDDAKSARTAKLFSLSEEMEFQLPETGETFILTSGVTDVARCVVLKTGECDVMI